MQERVNKEFATEEERALAMSILTDKETPLKALEKRKKENKKRHDQDINDFTEAEYNALQKEGHQAFRDDGSQRRGLGRVSWDLSGLFTSWYGFFPKTDKQILSFFFF